MIYKRLFNTIRVATLIAATCLSLSAWAGDLCPDYHHGPPQFNPANHQLCVSLWPKAATPSNPDGTPKPLNEYEADVGQFFNNFCHRDPQLTGNNGTGWAQDKDVRDLGPYVAFRSADGGWDAAYHGFHSPVVIWYSPLMIEWIKTNRPEDESKRPANPAPVPDGAIIVKEMYTAPGVRCRDRDVENLKPSSGIAYMVRDSKASHDGWFWGYFGFFDGQRDPNIDWPQPQADRNPQNQPNYSEFGNYCVNCHASAVDNSTFSTLNNIKGFGGEPLVYLSNNWILTEFEGDKEGSHTPPSFPAPDLPNSTPYSSVPETWGKTYAIPPGQKLADVVELTLPSQAYDNVWVAASVNGEVPLKSEYVTSDQCLACHDAGSTGLSFDMTKPNPHGMDLINLSPYSTWRTSPMGLAGRDPIFFGQVASEEEFHSDYVDTIWNTCFGCHGIMGQRQFQLDQAEMGVSCDESVFQPEYFTATPYDDGKGDVAGPHFDATHAEYGALARDGISCTSCHRAVLNPAETEQVKDEAQNQCVLARQQQLNGNIGNLTGFGSTFTGSFLVNGPEVVKGPFKMPKTKPMQHALGNTPEFDTAIASSEQCGTCHTVHLPVLWPKKPGEDKLNVVGDTYEQTTYPEWLFSDFRTGEAAFLKPGASLPGGAGANPKTCAECHMESHDVQGKPFASKIASIQERSNMPEVENALPREDIDLETREGFARHTLVGLNLFLIKMAPQFSDLLGLDLVDPMLGKKGMPPIQRTQDLMLDNAQSNTADISIGKIDIENDSLIVDVRIDNKAGHKFPSGVSFRRAFVEFEVLSANGTSLWHSGRTDQYGVLVDKSDNPLNGELWYDLSCNKIVDQTDFQPHYRTITSPDQVQIYQEVKLDPGDPAVVTGQPSCGEEAQVEPSANLTTSFLSICHTTKDNRLLPVGMLPMETRVEISKLMGLVNDGEATKLAEETGAKGVNGDPDYVTGGGDTVTFSMALGSMADIPATVQATLHYQATPPFFLQDRFCNGKGINHDRLYHISSLLDTSNTPIEDWNFKMVTTGPVAVTK